jgi:hypothetical protein
LLITRGEDSIVLDPQTVGMCVVNLDEDAARALFEALRKWFA